MAHHTDEDLVQCWQLLISLHASAKLYRDMHAYGPWRQADAGAKLDADLEAVNVMLKRMEQLRGNMEAARKARK